MKDEFKPCPFCGSPASKSKGKYGDGKPWHYVECEKCGAATDIDVWNKRVTQSNDHKDKITEAAIKWRKEFSSSAELELIKAVDECIKK